MSNVTTVDITAAGTTETVTIIETDDGVTIAGWGGYIIGEGPDLETAMSGALRTLIIEAAA